MILGSLDSLHLRKTAKNFAAHHISVPPSPEDEDRFVSRWESRCLFTELALDALISFAVV